MTKYQIRVEEIIELNPYTKTYRLSIPENVTWTEGAHIHLAHPGFDEGEAPDKSLVRHMSISSLAHEGYMDVTTRVPGSGSDYKKRMKQLKKGDSLVVFKVESRMGLRRDNRPIVLISMGVGMATMRGLIKQYQHDRNACPRLININIDSRGNHVFKEELSVYEDECYENYWITNRLDLWTQIQVTIDLEPIYYLVGSDEFLKSLIDGLKDLGVRASDIVLDKKAQAFEELLAE